MEWHVKAPRGSPWAGRKGRQGRGRREPCGRRWVYLRGLPKPELHPQSSPRAVPGSVLPHRYQGGVFSPSPSCLGSVAVPSVAQVRWRLASCIS